MLPTSNVIRSTETSYSCACIWLKYLFVRMCGNIACRLLYIVNFFPKLSYVIISPRTILDGKWLNWGYLFLNFELCLLLCCWVVQLDDSLNWRLNLKCWCCCQGCGEAALQRLMSNASLLCSVILLITILQVNEHYVNTRDYKNEFCCIRRYCSNMPNSWS